MCIINKCTSVYTDNSDDDGDDNGDGDNDYYDDGDDSGKQFIVEMMSICE
jgi:hypothetical protein